ncbi:MAG TPA: hypothetical protein VHB98_22880, partial [Chloroflexota bacterium]|nr:hypothetical protein [Chloroflexota bacterium]
MKRLVAVLGALLIAGTAGGLAVHAVVPNDLTYSVSQLDAGLRRHPAAFVGHVVDVRGVVGFCPTTIGCPPNIPPILSPRLGQLSAVPPLQLDYGSGNTLLGTLRDLPLLGTMIPPPAHLVDGFDGVLRV